MKHKDDIHEKKLYHCLAIFGIDHIYPSTNKILFNPGKITMDGKALLLVFNVSLY